MSNLDFQPRNVYQASRSKKKVLLRVHEPAGEFVEQAVIGVAESIDSGLSYNFKNGISKVELRFTSVEKAKEFQKYIETGSTFTPFERFVMAWTNRFSK